MQNQYFPPFRRALGIEKRPQAGSILALVTASVCLFLLPAGLCAQTNTGLPMQSGMMTNQPYSQYQPQQNYYTPPSRSSFGNSSSSSSGSHWWDNNSSSKGNSTSSRYNRSNSKSTSTKGKRPSGTSPAPGVKTTLRSSALRSGGMMRSYKSSSSSSKSILSEFHLHVDTNATILYLDPPDNTVAKGDTFKTRITISNPTGKPFDDLRLALHYNRDVLQPLSYADKSLKPLLAGSSQIEVNPRVGVLLYTAHLQRPFNSVTDPLFEVKWRALATSNRANITFVGYQKKPSGIWMGTTDVLGSPDNPDDGFINASVQILPPDLLAQFKNGSRRSQGNTIEDVSLDELPASMGGVSLRLVGPKGPVEVGKTFKVNIVLDNSSDSYLDRVDVYLRYNPDVLQVLDTDNNNWITRGINILDGPYHANFPFDYMIEDQVYEGRGQIVYRMGMTDPERLRHRVGTLATITFLAKAPAPSTAITFQMPEQSFSPGTKLQYLQESVLGDAETGNTGVKGLNLRVLN